MSARIRLTPYNRSKAVDMVRSAPDGYLFMPPREPTRSTAQNARLWAMLGDISKQVIWTVNGHPEKLAPEDWKAIITASLAQESRMAPGVRGGFVMLGTSTRSMTIRQMTEMIEFLFAFGAEQDVTWSDPTLQVPEQYREAA